MLKIISLFIKKSEPEIKFYGVIEMQSHTFYVKKSMIQPAIAAMHGPHRVFDISHCTVIHCDAEGVSLVDQ